MRKTFSVTIDTTEDGPDALNGFISGPEAHLVINEFFAEIRKQTKHTNKESFTTEEIYKIMTDLCDEYGVKLEY